MGLVVKGENVMVKCEVVFVHGKKSYGREEAQLHLMLSSALDGCERRDSHPFALPPRIAPPVPIQ